MVTWPFNGRFARTSQPSPAGAEAIIGALSQLEMDNVGEIGAFVILPDHLTVILKPTTQPLNRVMGALRRAVQHKLLRGDRHYNPFAKQYFPRRLNPDELGRVVSQILRRPVTRHLCEHPSYWPFSSANPEVARLFRHLINPAATDPQAAERAIECQKSKYAEIVKKPANDTSRKTARRSVKAPSSSENGADGTQNARGRKRDAEGALNVSVMSPQVTSGAKRVRESDRWAHLRQRLKALLTGLHRRIVPWDPNWQPRAEERRAELPEGSRWARQGQKAEEYVARWLWLRGFRIVARNVRCSEGELDIVARKGGKLIAVEVRSYVEGGERPGERMGWGKRRSIWRSLRRFQELREAALGHLELQALLAEVQFSATGRLVSITLYPLRPLH